MYSFYCTLTSYKGYFDLVEALKILKSKTKEKFKLVIVGKDRGIERQLRKR